MRGRWRSKSKMNTRGKTLCATCDDERCGEFEGVKGNLEKTCADRDNDSDSD